MRQIAKYDSVFEKILEELRRQDFKWGEDRTLDIRTWNTILMEEVGEVAKASLEHDEANYVEELIQVAAVSVAALHQVYSGR